MDGSENEGSQSIRLATWNMLNDLPFTECQTIIANSQTTEGVEIDVI